MRADFLLFLLEIGVVLDDDLGCLFFELLLSLSDNLALISSFAARENDIYINIFYVSVERKTSFHFFLRSERILQIIIFLIFLFCFEEKKQGKTKDEKKY